MVDFAWCRGGYVGTEKDQDSAELIDFQNFLTSHLAGEEFESAGSMMVFFRASPATAERMRNLIDEEMARNPLRWKVLGVQTKSPEPPATGGP